MAGEAPTAQDAFLQMLNAIQENMRTTGEQFGTLGTRMKRLEQPRRGAPIRNVPQRQEPQAEDQMPEREDDASDPPDIPQHQARRLEPTHRGRV